MSKTSIEQRRKRKTKTCTVCGKDKPISEFYFRRKLDYTHKSECKICFNKKAKKYTNNQKTPCLKCGKLCWSSKNCKSCSLEKSFEHYSTLTLGDKTYDNHKYSKYQYIRYYARKKGLELGWKKCCKCPYDKHIEIAHIKAISTFPKDTLIITINDESNLIPLCPNCHWEYDHH